MKRYNLVTDNSLAEYDFQNRGKYKILIVDDSKDFLRFTSWVFKEEDCLVELLNNSSDALKAFIEFKPDFVFLDLKMPGIGGITLLKTLSEINIFNSKIILMSANRNYSESLRSTERASYYTFIEKPISGDRLLEIVMGERAIKIG